MRTIIFNFPKYCSYGLIIGKTVKAGDNIVGKVIRAEEGEDSIIVTAEIDEKNMPIDWYTREVATFSISVD